MRVERAVEVDRPPHEVFAFMSDALNDPQWCPKVLSVTQISGDGPGPGAGYEVWHRPVPLRPARRMAHVCTGWAAPHEVRWHEDDGSDVLEVAYRLQPSPRGGTRVVQRSQAQLGAPRLLHPVLRAGIGHDVARQLRQLKRLLERRS